jgi:hypothetical protein
MKKEFLAIAATLCFGSIGNGWAATPKAGMTKDAYDAAKDRIEAQFKADQKLCVRAKGNARDVCQAQAQGRQEALVARLDAQYNPSAAATEEAKEKTAEANYRVAREKCDALKGAAKDKCIDAAKAGREAALRQARVEKVDSTGGIFGRNAAAKAAVKPPKPS